MYIKGRYKRRVTVSFTLDELTYLEIVKWKGDLSMSAALDRIVKDWIRSDPDVYEGERL